MAHFNITVDPEISDAFRRYCEFNKIKPYSLLALTIRGYARAEMLREAWEEGRLDKAQALADMGQLIREFQAFAKLNGTFREMVVRAAGVCGVGVQDLMI